MWIKTYRSQKKPEGLIFGLFITLVFLSRFFIEFVKVEQADYSTGSALTVGQYLSIPFILGGLAVCAYALKRRPASRGE